MNKIEKDLKKNGFVLIKGFLSKEKNFLDFKKYLNNFLMNSLNIKKNANLDLDAVISHKFNKKKNFSAYINDNINL